MNTLVEHRYDHGRVCFARRPIGAGVCSFIVFSAALAVFVSYGFADQDLPGRVDRIIDGDSLIVYVGGRQLEVRLWGIDSPEYDQPGSQMSAAALQRLTSAKTVRLHIRYQDRFGRSVAELFQAGSSINEQMVSGGYSWVHPYFCKGSVCRSWKRLEEEAQRKGSGIWSLDNPIPPWQWKKRR